MSLQDAASGPVVLLLEDVPLLRIALADLIEEAGCQVIETHDTAEVIHLLETRPDIRVVVADLDVRGSAIGLQLAALIRERWPPVELMLTGALRPNQALPVRGHFFGKPFQPNHFILTLRQFARIAPPQAAL